MAQARRWGGRSMIWLRNWLIGISAAVLLMLVGAAPAEAATITVTSTADTDGSCPTSTSCTTLRKALETAAAGDTIRFSATGAILLEPARGSLLVPKNVTIEGPGPAALAVDGQSQVRVFNVSFGVQTSFSGLTIRNGYAPAHGAGIFASSGSVAITNCVFTGNGGTGSPFGAAVTNMSGILTVTDSTFTDNLGSGIINYQFGGLSQMTLRRSTLSRNAGSGVVVWGKSGPMDVTDSILNDNDIDGITVASTGGQVTVTDTTIHGNDQDGIAVHNDGEGNGGAVIVTRSTISGHPRAGVESWGAPVAIVNSTVSGNPGHGIIAEQYTAIAVTNGTVVENGQGIHLNGGTVSLRNTIVAKHPGTSNCSARPTTLGNNLSDSDACFPGDSARGDIVRSTAQLLIGPLALNAPGKTRTHALLPGSPAIDGVIYYPPIWDNPSESVDCPTWMTTDQRGAPRPQARIAVRCDIGAFELEANTPPTISAVAPQTTDEDRATQAISFTVGDEESGAAGVTVTGASSVSALVPTAGIQISSGGVNRTVTITPAANQAGTAEITLTAGDGTASVSTRFVLTVNAVNDAPVNTVPGPQTTNEGTPLQFTAGKGNLISVADLDVGTGTLQVALTATHGTLRLAGTNGLAVSAGADGTAGVTVSGTPANLNAALHGLTFTPIAGYNGPASVTIETSDGGASGSGGTETDVETIVITVAAVNDPPSAINDSYSVGAVQTLTVSPAQGVLVNDADPDSPRTSLIAEIVSGPTKGTLALARDGGFTYTPIASFAGTDTFTYLVSDGPARSSPATVTIAVVAGHCAPRATVRVTTSTANGRLQAVVEALPLDGQSNNRLISLSFGELKNARVTIDGQPFGRGDSYVVPPNTTKVTLLVERTAAGQATTVPFTAQDVCGSWPSFVGGGAGAGF